MFYTWTSNRTWLTLVSRTGKQGTSIAGWKPTGADQGLPSMSDTRNNLHLSSIVIAVPFPGSLSKLSNLYLPLWSHTENRARLPRDTLNRLN